MSWFKKWNNINALHMEIIQGKCPYAEHMNNIQKKSYKELEENLGLEYTKKDMTESIRLLYNFCKDSIEDKGSIEDTIKNMNNIVNANGNIITQIDQKFWWNEEITNRLIAWFGTAIRTILSLRDVYLKLWWESRQVKDAIRKMVYQLASVSVRDFALTNQRLKEDSDVLSIKNRDYSPENFDIDNNGNLIVKPGIVDEMRKWWRCPVVWMKSEEGGDIIIDDMIERLLQ